MAEAGSRPIPIPPSRGCKAVTFQSGGESLIEYSGAPVQRFSLDAKYQEMSNAMHD